MDLNEQIEWLEDKIAWLREEGTTDEINDIPYYDNILESLNRLKDLES